MAANDARLSAAEAIENLRRANAAMPGAAEVAARIHKAVAAQLGAKIRAALSRGKTDGNQ